MAGLNSVLVGYGKGNNWNDNTKKYEIKKIKHGDWLAIGFGINVSGKTKDGQKQYGKPIDVIMTLNNRDDLAKVNFDEPMIIEGFFVPNNWDKDGKEIKGNQFKCHINDYTQITLDQLTGKDAAPTSKTTPPVIEVDEDEIPF